MASIFRSYLSSVAVRVSPTLRSQSAISPFKRVKRSYTTRTASTSSTSGGGGGGGGGFRLTPTNAVLVFVPILTGALGIWQIKRLRWKVALIDEVDSNMAKTPMILPDHIDLSRLPDYSFRRVLVKGHFAPTYILLGPRVYEGFPGTHLIQPFIRTPSDPTSQPTTILVNRGFITSTRADAIRSGKEKPPPGPNIEEDGQVVIEGMLKREEKQGSFQPTNDPKGNLWFWSDVKAMAEWVGGEEQGVQAVLVDQIYDNNQPATMLLQQGIPVGRPPVVELRNMHATYAATWLSLSAATTIMLVRLLRKGRGGQSSTGNQRIRSY